MSARPLLLALSVHAALACTAPPPPAPTVANPAPPPKPVAPPPPVAPPSPPLDREAEAAADRMRDAILGRTPEDCLAAAEAALRGPTTSGRLRGWAVACIAETGRQLQAEEAAAEQLRTRADDPWSEFAALAALLAEERLPEPIAVPRTAALVDALAGHPDALLLRARALLKFERFDEVAALADAHPSDMPLQALRARALFGRAGDDEARRVAAIAAAARIEGPASVDVAIAASRWLPAFDRHAEARRTIDAAIALHPRSVPLHRERLRLTDPLEVAASVIAELLATRGDSPAALSAAITADRKLGRSSELARLEARLLGEFADSPEAEWYLVDRAMADHYGDPPLTRRQAAAHRDELAALLQRPRWHSPHARAWTAEMHFTTLRDLPGTTPDALLAAVETMLAHRRHNLERPYAEGARALALSTPHLARAEAIAREGLVAVEAWAAARTAAGVPAETITRDRDAARTAIEAALEVARRKAQGPHE